MASEIGNRVSKRSQITIFVIIGLILIVSTALIFVLVRKPEIRLSPELAEDPRVYIDKCTADALENVEERIIEGNGYFNLTNNYVLFSKYKPGEKVPYLCKSSQFYKPCINQEPLFLEKIKRDAEKELQPMAEQCFLGLIENMKKRGYQVSSGPLNLSVNFKQGIMSLDMNKRIMRTNNLGESEIFETFSTRIKSPIYELVDTGRSIVNYESTLCQFDMIEWMNYYRDVDIKKFVTGDQIKIYTLTDRVTNQSMNLAIRTCVLPAGI